MSEIRWFISGKHPMFADYLRFGSTSHFVSTFNKWVTQGFEGHVATDGSARQQCAYRFWAKADEKTLALGVLQSSSDSLGRPFPLLILGTAPFLHWQEQWPGIMGLLEDTWSKMEDISTGRYEKPASMARDLAAITLPVLSADRLAQGGHASAPNTAFIGGCNGKKATIYFTKPLTTQDFISLWTNDS